MKKQQSVKRSHSGSPFDISDNTSVACTKMTALSVVFGKCRDQSDLRNKVFLAVAATITVWDVCLSVTFGADLLLLGPRLHCMITKCQIVAYFGNHCVIWKKKNINTYPIFLNTIFSHWPQNKNNTLGLSYHKCCQSQVSHENLFRLFMLHVVGNRRLVLSGQEPWLIAARVH